MKYPKHKHCSPDSLIGDDGMIEIKCVIPSIFAELKATQTLPTAHRKQIQWSLHISGRMWCDYVVYCEQVAKKIDPLLIIRIARDDTEIQILDEGADKFIEEMQSLLIKVMKGV